MAYRNNIFILISNFRCVVNVLLPLFGDFPACEFYVPTFRNSVCSILIGGVSRKNNQDEIVGAFTRENFWLKNSLSRSEG